MKITTEADTLRISDLRELTEATGDALVDAIHAELTPAHAAIEFDLSHVQGIDSEIIDVLLALHEEFHLEDRPLVWRVNHPSPELRQLLELVRLHHLFEIIPPRPALATLS